MAKKKEWKEGEIALTFGLESIETYYTPLMEEWLEAKPLPLTAFEQQLFEETYQKAVVHIKTWSEEDLKMKFISPVLNLGKLMDDTNFVSMFDKSLSATVKEYKLSVKADFVIGSGLKDYMQKPYFHFQEYKPNKKPKGDSMAQLLEAFLIAQQENADGKPLYGCEVVGDTWRFLIMEGTTYCVSRNYDSTDRENLLQIIAILRKFRHILETVLLK
jgi:hypothetical protein